MIRPGLAEYLELWDTLSNITLSTMEDHHLWKWESSGTFSTRSAYRVFLVGSTTFDPWKRIWKSWAPSKCKTFIWLAIRNRCWTADRLQQRGLPHPAHCPLCDQEDETVQHLLTSCVFSRQFWFSILQPLGLIVTEFGVDASSHDPGTPFRFEGRGQRGSVSHSRLDRVPV